MLQQVFEQVSVKEKLKLCIIIIYRGLFSITYAFTYNMKVMADKIVYLLFGTLLGLGANVVLYWIRRNAETKKQKNTTEEG